MLHIILTFLSEHNVEVWTASGLTLLLTEMFIIPGLGCVFIGLGALSVGLLSMILPEIHDIQYIIFVISTLIWFILLWGPMKHFVHKNSHNFSVPNLIGSKVKVASPTLTQDSIGQVHWSGTIMNAKLASHVQREAKMGEELQVMAVQGNILICEPVLLSATSSK